MIAGLPRTGIGGIFYVLLVFWMPVEAGHRAASGQGRRPAWRLVAYQTMLVWGIIGALAAEAWVLKQVLPHVVEMVPGRLAGRGADGERFERTVGIVLPALAITPFVTLASIYGLLQVLRRLFPPLPVAAPALARERSLPHR